MSAMSISKPTLDLNKIVIPPVPACRGTGSDLSRRAVEAQWRDLPFFSAVLTDPFLSPGERVFKPARTLFFAAGGAFSRGENRSIANFP